MAEVLLADRLARRGVNARVHSAGLMSEGVPASAHSVRAMAKRGLTLDQHRSTPLDAEAIAEADLVVGMGREHVREAVVLAPGALTCAFTLKELVRRAEVVGPRRRVSAVPDPRRPSDPSRRPPDPLGRPGSRSAATTDDAPPPTADRLEPFAAWLERVAGGRHQIDLLGASPVDDVSDPIGRSRRTYARTASEIEDLVDRFVGLAFPVDATVAAD